ncbi:DegT/DnrJ/EryC1/StrS family aminotransferase [Clavibacter sp. VKM Ac-2872]|uniref:DegT/DnrJ/EryC1/StrS family aminotransferase n=1 Tax=Clavibacter sp. VKM Ac-2872 TaxID=2783812 RepID=UPI00188C8037|nr:DegT/DnrJ/EryC1/StrS family aminotransferase [Clavibacter sp. VKM Ac-2872]MBF4622767.1 DegT/DnrJ/EryC1/StrS family aminotransferase [Clavibacter sp. VKM Ac-2872]
MTADPREPVRGGGLPADVEAGIRAARRSKWAEFPRSPSLTQGWDICSWPDLRPTSAYGGRTTAVVVRELFSAAAATTMGFDAVIWDVGGSSEVSAPGEIAVVFARSAEVAERLRALRNHGQPVGRRFHHEQVGINARVDDALASYLLSELQALVPRRADIRARARALETALVGLAPHHVADIDGGGGVRVARVPGPLATVLDLAGVRWREVGEESMITVPTHLDADEMMELVRSIASALEPTDEPAVLVTEGGAPW